MNGMIKVNSYTEILPNPIEIVKQLDAYVIGQTAAKKTLALLLLNRALLKMKRANLLPDDMYVEKTNVMLLGPTGVGKTALLKALGEVADIPITIYDVTNITSAGYIGGKVEDILAKHVNNCDALVSASFQKFQASYNYYLHPLSEIEYLTEMVETGIVYLDEIDKIRAKRGVYEDIDVSGDMVQNELLKVLGEGNEVSLNSSRSVYPVRGISKVKTDDIMYVAGGAFHGLSDIIKQRLLMNSGIGFSSDLTNKILHREDEFLFRYVTLDDLLKYGFKYELLGRLPLRVALEPLSKEVLKEIMISSKNNIFDQYKAIFKLFEVDLKVDDQALDRIAEVAVKLKMGARSLKSIFADLLREPMYNMFESANTEFVVTDELVYELEMQYEL